ncbi:MAG: FtsQ-type POTRA domain-containing protein [Candidatus Bipolaricaulota bacterium]|nr:FtsQ-type POTRA domain-containing protein [Candidatus Bipolaricaulota bacterium]
MIRALRVGCLAGTLLILGFTAVRWGGWWRVEAVQVSPTRYVAAEQLTGILLGANVLRLQTGGLRDQIARDPRVLAVHIRVRPFAQRVDVVVKEREPTVSVRLENGAAVWVDREGVILAPAAEARVVGVRRQGDRVPRAVVEAARAVASLRPSVRDRFSTFDVSDPASVVARGEGVPTLLLGEIGQLGDRLAILEELWERGLLAGYATVDLRVGDEVVLKRKR